MTTEQVEDLFHQLEHLNPSEAEQAKFRDTEYDAENKRLAEEAKGVLWADTVVSAGPPPPTAEAPCEWEEIDEDWWHKHR